MWRNSRQAGQMRAEAGFTLVEALVAFAVLAMVLAVALPLLAGGMRSVETADHHLAALALAESKLADATATWPVPIGTTEGDDASGQRWQLRVDPVVAAAGARPRIVRYQVTATGPGQAFADGVQLVTYRLLVPETP